jgi:diacylglycerol kinase (ATP)
MLRESNFRRKGYYMKMGGRETVIIGNPNAGRVRRGDPLKLYAEVLRAGGLNVEVWPTERPQHATELATLAGSRLVVAGGGDSTVKEGVNGPAPSPPPPPTVR